MSDDDSLFVSIGIIGGVINIYVMINKIIAKGILFFMKKDIEKKKIIYKKNLKIKIELVSLLNDEFKDVIIGCNNAKDILNKLNQKKKKHIEIEEIVIDKNLFFIPPSNKKYWRI